MAVVLMIFGLHLVVAAFLITRRKCGYGRQLMFAGNEPTRHPNHDMDRWERKMARMQDKMDRKMDRVRDRVERFRGRGEWFASPSSGNAAFDDYRTETLKRLEDEQREFKEFLDRLRVAKDRVEFDQFMAARRESSFDPGSPSEPSPAEPRN